MIVPKKNAYYAFRQIRLLSIMTERNSVEDKWSSYKDAIKALNGLQSNAATVKAATCMHQHGEKSIKDSYKYLARAGLSLDDLNKLSIIHVAGTKGKGSTCAFTESILRNYGLKTGFYSSPHLIAVKERIRINGIPLESEKFVNYFWPLYCKLQAPKTEENDMPPYFKFLTLLAFKVFLEEKVDVAVVEVGIGGEYDCTNVIKSPVVCGVTSLDYDHTNVLGNTIEDIAWNKAGIFKPGVPAFTVTQPNDAMEVLKKRAVERQTSLRLCPNLTSYDWNDLKIQLGLAGEVQYINASLALQLCKTFIERTKCGGDFQEIPKMQFTVNHSKLFSLAASFQITCQMHAGLRECSWPGRSQIIERNSATYFLDGAHTNGSMQACIKWFKSLSFSSDRSIFRALIFNMTGQRDPTELLSLLSVVGFNAVIFCPNVAVSCVGDTSDQINVLNGERMQLNKCKDNQHIWSSLTSSSQNSNEKYQSHVFPCIKDALSWLDYDLNRQNGSQRSLPDGISDAKEVHLLVTGSLHLIGAVLTIIDPDLKLSSSKKTFSSC